MEKTQSKDLQKGSEYRKVWKIRRVITCSRCKEKVPTEGSRMINNKYGIIQNEKGTKKSIKGFGLDKS
jgi:hypothetical protein